MKKNTESFPAGKYDTEISRRLYRGALDSARRLEEFLRGSPRPDMLGSDVTSLRMRLKDYCERLLFSDSSEFGRKAEELMWRKVYYEPLQLHKQHRKKTVTPVAEGEDLLCGWLRSGVGHYHHLLWRLQTEFQLSSETNVNLAPPCLWKQRGLRKERWGRHHRSVCVRGREDWATQTAHRCLLCLGDLARYLCECGDPCAAYLSERYYRQAFLLAPSLGMPFNQMGTLVAMGPDSGCHALYFYMRCLLSPQSFEGAEGNIQRVFEKNQPVYDAIASPNAQVNNSQNPAVQRLLPRFLKLAELFFNQQDENLPPLCQDVLQDLDRYLTCPSQPAEKQQDGSVVDEAEEGDQELLTFRLGLVTVMSFTRLKIQGSPLVPASAAFALSLLSQVVRHCLGRLQVGLLLTPEDPPLDSPQTLDDGQDPVIEQDTMWPARTLEDGSRTRSTSGTLTPIVTINGTSQEECNGKLSTDEPEHSEHKNSQPWSTSLFRRKKRSSLLGHLRRRRRRNISCTSQDDSEVSNEEGDFGESDADNGISSDISETGSLHGGSDGSLTEQEEEDEETTKFAIKNDAACDAELLVNDSNYGEVTNGHLLDSDDSLLNGDDQKTSPQANLSSWETLEILTKEAQLLALVKVFSDWLVAHPDILTACMQSTRSLWKHFADLLNALLKAETTLLEAQEPLRSCLMSLRCPRPSCGDTISEDSPDSLNNNKNSPDLLAKTVSILSWKWLAQLPEDAELQLLPIFIAPSNNKNGKVKGELSDKNETSNSRIPAKLGAYEQIFGRLQCLIHFGLVLSLPKLQQLSSNNHHPKNGFAKTQHIGQLLRFVPEDNVFQVFEPDAEDLSKNLDSNNENNKNNLNGSVSNGQDTNEDLEGQRKQLMRNMAHLWLKAEVRDLEVRTGTGRVGRNGGNRWQSGRHHQYPSKGGQQGALQEGCLPPYLVPDAGALCHQLPALKQLQAAKCFILVLPASVISSLDELKRQSAFAREAIRWIESELRAGSRFLRAQKSQERLSLVPMKYPKRKEKEAWDFFQVLECCHYLNHSQGQGRAASGLPLATLVTGGNQFLPPNAAAIASSAGVSMESVEDFLNKWRNSFKS